MRPSHNRSVPRARRTPPVTVTCDVYAQQFDNQFASFAGTVHGTGPNRAAARANAESKIWGPYGSMPYVANCR